MYVYIELHGPQVETVLRKAYFFYANAADMWDLNASWSQTVTLLISDRCARKKKGTDET